MSEKDPKDTGERKTATGNFEKEQGKNVFRQRLPGANGVGSATLCGNKHLTQPGRPYSTSIVNQTLELNRTQSRLSSAIERN